MRVDVARSAEIDLLEGFSFYEQQQPGIGEYFLDSLFSDIDALALFGGIHACIDGRLYRTLSKRFPFAIYYTVAGDVATVVAVLDWRMNPSSLTERLRER